MKSGILDFATLVGATLKACRYSSIRPTGRYPKALARTIKIVERCKFRLDELAYQYPEEKLYPELASQQALEKLTWEGATERYLEGLPGKVQRSLEHELRLIEKLDYGPAFDLLAEHKAIRLDLATIPAEETRTYAMIRRADTLGTFQIESRAQMAMLPRIKPRTFYDLVIEVAIVRPSPIQGDMVHPYLRRREGKEDVVYPKPELEAVLGKTLGVPLFQEQAMRVAIECAGFTAGEADQLRRAMATFKHTGGVSKFGHKLIQGMVDNGYEREFAERTFRQLEGFGSYGFPESHAASFALIAYASSWIKCWHPDVFCAALLNAQPMGFYAPAKIVRDAQQHGVEIRPVCVNASRWDCTLEPRDADDGRLAVRLGLRMVKGLGNAEAARLISCRSDQPYSSVDDLWRRPAIPAAALGELAEADAFRPSIGLARRDEPLPLFAAAADREAVSVAEQDEPIVSLRPMTAGSEVVEDYGHVGLTLRQHPVSFLRADLTRRRIVTYAEAVASLDRRWVDIAGLVIVRQRPGSATGVMFIKLEDETAVANLVVCTRIFEKYRRIVLGAGMIGVKGRVQRDGEVVYIVAHHLTDLSSELASVSSREAGFPLPHGRGDEFHRGSPVPDPRGLPKLVTCPIHYAEIGILDLIPSRRLYRSSCLRLGTSDRIRLARST
ncbi:helix-hairpin-helix domain-containing protein [Foliimonas ilicis]